VIEPLADVAERLSLDDVRRGFGGGWSLFLLNQVGN
jgi:hypothetical protein